DLDQQCVVEPALNDNFGTPHADAQVRSLACGRCHHASKLRALPERCVLSLRTARLSGTSVQLARPPQQGPIRERLAFAELPRSEPAAAPLLDPREPRLRLRCHLPDFTCTALQRKNV